MLPGLYSENCLFMPGVGSSGGTNGAPEHSPSRGIQALLGGSIMRKLVGLAIVASALMVSACNTVEGAGKDVASAGKTVAKTADNAK
jgi:predicted small secreted protein